MIVCRLVSGCKEMDGDEVVGDIVIAELGFECLAAGWFDDNVGLFFLMDKVAEGGDITRLCVALPAVVWRWTRTRS